ncbi:MAG: carbohydrate-binding family 9-like protein [Bacteroidota bacterium]
MSASKFLLVALAFFSTLTPSASQDVFKGHEALFTKPRGYTVFRTNDQMVIDGKPQEASWNKVDWSEYFIDIEGANKTAPRYKTRFKLLWDTSTLYVLVDLEEPNLWASIHKRDAIIYQDNDIEIFIDPDGDTHEYYEVEINAHNTVFDLFMPRPYRNGGRARIGWDAAGFRSAVQLKGTLNKPGDKDDSWQVEMAIPFRALNASEVLRIPAAGATWRINFSRVQWDLDIVGDRYVKKVDSSTRRSLPEHNWVWSPQGVINMHYPERWGHVFFSSKAAGASNPSITTAGNEHLKNYLWLLYYKQQSYRRQLGRYAASLNEIQLPANIKRKELEATIQLNATGDQFNATIAATDGTGWKIDETGKILPVE